MSDNQTVEKRLDKIERLLQCQKSVLTFEEGCEFTGFRRATCTNSPTGTKSRSSNRTARTSISAERN